MDKATPVSNPNKKKKRHRKRKGKTKTNETANENPNGRFVLEIDPSCKSAVPEETVSSTSKDSLLKNSTTPEAVTQGSICFNLNSKSAEENLACNAVSRNSISFKEFPISQAPIPITTDQSQSQCNCSSTDSPLSESKKSEYLNDTEKLKAKTLISSRCTIVDEIETTVPSIKNQFCKFEAGLTKEFAQENNSDLLQLTSGSKDPVANSCGDLNIKSVKSDSSPSKKLIFDCSHGKESISTPFKEMNSSKQPVDRLNTVSQTSGKGNLISSHSSNKSFNPADDEVDCSFVETQCQLIRPSVNNVEKKNKQVSSKQTNHTLMEKKDVGDNKEKLVGNAKIPREKNKKKEADVNLKNKQEKTNDVSKSIDEKADAGSRSDDTKPAGSQKSKAELKAERRALQEAQRAAKAGLKAKPTTQTISTASVTPKSSVVQNDSKVIVKNEKLTTPSLESVKSSITTRKRAQFFSHLQQFKLIETPLIVNGIHASIIQLGLQYRNGIIVGSNARCVALLHALKQVIADYVTPPKTELSRDLQKKIDDCVRYLQEQRPLSVSMENAAKFLKRHMTQMPSDYSDSKAKQLLNDEIDSYIKENVILADQAIESYALSKISDGDVILTFGHSSAICAVLRKAFENGKQFNVIVVDSQPKMTGKKTVLSLVRLGMKCSYILINALSYTMQKVTKVFLGAHSLLANGYVMGRVGSSQIALVAKAYNVPVLVCCETYKFSERVQTDSFVYNELGNPEDLRHPTEQSDPLKEWQTIPSLNLLNLTYDVTPPELVSVVVTELGMLPCTSVPVVLRVKQPKA